VTGLTPRDGARLAAFTLCFGFAWHMLDRIIAGLARCPIEHCLQTQPPPTTKESPTT
jgi:hypothetical protein